MGEKTELTAVVNTHSWADREQRAQESGIRIVGENLTEDDPMIAVRLQNEQRLAGFPKFGTWGLGFWNYDHDANCNLPFDCPALEIWEHIKRNSAVAVHQDEVIKAIELLQVAIPWFCSEYGIPVSYDPRIDTLRRYPGLTV